MSRSVDKGNESKNLKWRKTTEPLTLTLKLVVTTKLKTKIAKLIIRASFTICKYIMLVCKCMCSQNLLI